MERETAKSDSVEDSLKGMSRAAKLFIRVDKEGFLIDSLAISDVVNFDCIESIVTSAKRIISLFVNVKPDEVDISGLFYYKKRARSLRMNPVPLATTTDGFRAIAEHPSGEIPLGIEWERKNGNTTSTVTKQNAQNVNNVVKRSRSVSPASKETDVAEKKRKLDVPVKYKTYMPATGGVEISSAEFTSTPSEADTKTKHFSSQVQEEMVLSPKEKTKATNEGSVLLLDHKKIQQLKLSDTGFNEQSMKRHPRQVKSNYQWTEDVTCEVILTYDGVSERKKLKPGISSVVQSLLKGNYNVLRSDLHQSLSIVDTRQSNQDMLNSLGYREDDNKTITYLHDAKSEIYKVLSMLSMSKARFKDLLDWMKTLKLEEGHQGKYYLSERNVIGGGLKVMYDTDEQSAARLISLQRARAKAKEKTKLLYPVTPLQSSVNVGKPGERQFMIMVPATSTAAASVTTATSSDNTMIGEPAVAGYPTVAAVQPLVQVVQTENAQPHPAWSKEILNKPSEPRTSYVSLLNSTSVQTVTSASSVQAKTKTVRSTLRSPNILRNKSHKQVQKLVPPTGDPVPMQLYRSYKTGKDLENPHKGNSEIVNQDDFDPKLPVIIKKEPVDHDNNDEGPDDSSDDKSLGSEDYNFGVVIKTEPMDDYGT